MVGVFTKQYNLLLAYIRDHRIEVLAYEWHSFVRIHAAGT